MRSFITACAALVCLAGSAAAATVRQLPIPTNDLTYDRVRGLLYATVPSTVAEYANSIIAIDPQTGAVVKSLFVGSEPNKLALSRDCSLLYVGFYGASAIRPVDLAAWQARPAFPLPTKFTGGYATMLEDLAVAPDNAETVVASLRAPDYFRGGAVVCFDGGKPRRRAADWGVSGNRVEFSSLSSRLFGAVNLNSTFPTFRLDLKKKGLWGRPLINLDVNGLDTDIRYAAGRLYVTNGPVLDPYRNVAVGVFPVSSYGWYGDLIPDPARHRAYAIRGQSAGSDHEAAGTWNLVGFSTDTYTAQEKLEIPDVQGRATSLTRYGASGFAFRAVQISNVSSTETSTLYLVDWPEVPAAPDLSGDWQALKGSGSGKGAKARFKWTGKLTVRSEGANDVPRTGVRYFVSDDAVLDAGDVLAGQYDVPALAANGSVTLKVKIAGPKGLSGRGKYLLAQLDGYNEVAEPNEANNVAAFGPLP